jgi:hypothetical protein
MNFGRIYLPSTHINALTCRFSSFVLSERSFSRREAAATRDNAVRCVGARGECQRAVPCRAVPCRTRHATVAAADRVELVRNVEFCLLDSDALQSVENRPTFRRNTSLSLSLSLSLSMPEKIYEAAVLFDAFLLVCS